MSKILQPDGWVRPRGYSNGILAQGRWLFVAGQIGWDSQERFTSDDFIEQARQALKNTVAVLAAGGARPEHIVRMTWYIVDKQEYLSRQREFGAAWREIIGAHYPAMAMVQVAALIEDRARVEVETTAVLPDA
ncbi:MAG TPA: RidA family protein [Candidatus Binatia bacterium]|nr:RidA family protein [Candidatus Binatia bacterium]